MSRRTGLEEVFFPCHTWPKTRCKERCCKLGITVSNCLSVPSGNFLGMENLQGFEGLSALEESAVRLHEIYKSLMTGGFTEDEALSLIAKMTKPNSE
jgi:hypothetical protein